MNRLSRSGKYQFTIKHCLLTTGLVVILVPQTKSAIARPQENSESKQSTAVPLLTEIPFYSKNKRNWIAAHSNSTLDPMLSVVPRIIIQKEIEEEPVGLEVKIQDDERPKIPRPVKVYMGRRVAQTMHYEGAEWLIRDEREREERCSLMLASLGLKPRQTVCDMGCGNGFYTLQIAKMLGEKGTVIGVDVQPEMLSMLRNRMEAEEVENVVPILGSFHTPRLAPGIIDLVLMVDVYHEFSHPEPMLAEIRKSLKPDGQIVLVEYRAEDPSVPIKPLHKMSKKQINREMKANGFKLNSEFDRLPWQHMMFFGIDHDWKPKN